MEQTQSIPDCRRCAIRVGSSAVALNPPWRASVAALPAGLLNLVYDCGTSNNNGNLHSQQIGASDPGQSLSWQQVYVYDGLNLLTTAAPDGVVGDSSAAQRSRAGIWNVTDGYMHTATGGNGVVLAGGGNPDGRFAVQCGQ